MVAGKNGSVRIKRWFIIRIKYCIRLLKGLEEESVNSAVNFSYPRVVVPWPQFRELLAAELCHLCQVCTCQSAFTPFPSVFALAQDCESVMEQ